MEKKERKPIDEQVLKMGQKMDGLTFSEFVRDLTGVPFDMVFQGFNNKGKLKNEKGNME